MGWALGSLPRSLLNLFLRPLSPPLILTSTSESESLDEASASRTACFSAVFLAWAWASFSATYKFFAYRGIRKGWNDHRMMRTDLQENLMLQILRTGEVRENRSTLHRRLDQGIAEDACHYVDHPLLLFNSTVNLGRDEERVRGCNECVFVDGCTHIPQGDLRG